MSRSWIVCGTCQGTWPIQGTPTPYLEMQLESQPCPRCEAYTLSCLALRDLSILPVEPVPSSDQAEPLAEAWRADES